jgi:hypothetical protein
MSRCVPRLGVALLMVVVPQIVAANVSVPLQVTFDSVDFVEIRNEDTCDGCSRSFAFVVVRGVVSGHGTPSTNVFNFGTNKDMATRCERLATIAMTKPGKYQFSIGADSSSSADGGHGHCQLSLVAP